MALKARAASFRRRAILNRIHNALDAFYLLQRIDWDYDIRNTVDKILATALEEIEFGEGRQIERALLIIEGPTREALEVKAGWKVEELDLQFSRTVVQQAMEQGEPILCENAKDDPRFLEAESLKELSTLSLICVPILLVDRVIGALYIESHSASNIFGEEDLEFLTEFARAIGPYLKMALVHQGHLLEIQKLQSVIDQRYAPGNIVGRSEAMRQVFEMVRLASTVVRTVLITGESGSGKEMIARAIHHQSARKSQPLITVDCSGLSESLLESELFGHVEGAFTGARGEKLGAFEEASGGTIFLDEISDAPRSLQQKLRRVLQEGEIRRVGESRHRKVDVRVICATNRVLPEMVERGEFIKDLFFRINQLPIHLPPLRERREDIPLLAQHFIAESAGEDGEPPSIEQEAIELLSRLDWKENNVRQLRNTVGLAVDIARPGPITVETVERVLRIQGGESASPSSRRTTGSSFPPDAADEGPVWIDREAFRERLREIEASEDGAKIEKRDLPFYRLQCELAARAILEALEVTRWKLRPAARLLGISPTKLRGELREFLGERLEAAGGDLDAVARDLEIDAHQLRKKAGDFGLEP